MGEHVFPRTDTAPWAQSRRPVVFESAITMTTLSTPCHKICIGKIDAIGFAEYATCVDFTQISEWFYFGLVEAMGEIAMLSPVLGHYFVAPYEGGVDSAVKSRWRNSFNSEPKICQNWY